MDKLLEILRELNLETDVQTETALVDEEILSSFDLVTLVAEIDNAFGVVIPPEELTAENFNSARALYDLILRLAAG